MCLCVCVCAHRHRRQFKPLIASNYMAGSEKFLLELSKKQAGAVPPLLLPPTPPLLLLLGVGKVQAGAGALLCLFLSPAPLSFWSSAGSTGHGRHFKLPLPHHCVLSPQAAELCNLFRTAKEKQGGGGGGGSSASIASLSQQLAALNPSSSSFVPSQVGPGILFSGGPGITGNPGKSRCQR